MVYYATWDTSYSTTTTFSTTTVYDGTIYEDPDLVYDPPDDDGTPSTGYTDPYASLDASIYGAYYDTGDSSSPEPSPEPSPDPSPDPSPEPTPDGGATTDTDTSTQPTTTSTGSASPAPQYVKDIALLYEAGLDRQFDAWGLNAWIDRYEFGTTFPSMAEQFLDSAEFTQRYGDDDLMNDGDFIVRMYANVLDRAPDQSGYDAWLFRMDNGMSREDVLVQFALSEENKYWNQHYVDLIGEVSPGYWDIAG